jgi:hypothetical protein
MRTIHLAACLSLCAVTPVLGTACNDPKTPTSPDIHLDQPAAKAPSINADDLQAPKLGGPAPRAPSINATRQPADAGATP